MKLLVGLGNPGAQYSGNRHNIGFMAIDAIADRYRFPAFKSKFQGEFTEGDIGGQRVTLLKPMTYMNLSGESVGALARFYKITPGDIAVFHDELDLPLAKVRVKKGGGHGGHNGLRSIDQHMGQDYWRIRLGIGHPGIKDLVSPYVLSNFPKIEQMAVEKLLTSTTDHIALLLADDAPAYMSKIATDIPVSAIPEKA